MTSAKQGPRAARAALLAIVVAASAPGAASAATTVSDVVAASGATEGELLAASGLTARQLDRFTVGAAKVSGFSAAQIGTILLEYPELIPGIAVEQAYVPCANSVPPTASEIDTCTIDERDLLPAATIGYVETNDPEVEDAVETPDSAIPPVLPSPDHPELPVTSPHPNPSFYLVGKGKNTLKSLLGSTIAYVKVHIEWRVEAFTMKYRGGWVTHADADVTTGGYLSGWAVEQDLYTPAADRSIPYRGKDPGGGRFWRAARFKQTLPFLPDPKKTVNTKLYPHWDFTCTGCSTVTFKGMPLPDTP